MVIAGRGRATGSFRFETSTRPRQLPMLPSAMQRARARGSRASASLRDEVDCIGGGYSEKEAQRHAPACARAAWRPFRPMRPPACCLILVRFPCNLRRMKSDREERALAMTGPSEFPARHEIREPTVPVAYAEKTMSTL